MVVGRGGKTEGNVEHTIRQRNWWTVGRMAAIYISCEKPWFVWNIPAWFQRVNDIWGGLTWVVRGWWSRRPELGCLGDDMEEKGQSNVILCRSPRVLCLLLNRPVSSLLVCPTLTCDCADTAIAGPISWSSAARDKVTWEGLKWAIAFMRNNTLVISVVLNVDFPVIQGNRQFTFPCWRFPLGAIWMGCIPILTCKSQKMLLHVMKKSICAL